MPSVARIKQLFVAGVIATALLGVATSDAAAGDVWFWACHGPASAQGTRAAINTAPVSATSGDGAVSRVNGGCGGGPDAVSFTKAGSATLKLPDAPDPKNSSSPPSVLAGLNISKVRVIRHAHLVDGANYSLKYNDQVLEHTGQLAANDDWTYNVTGSGPLTFELSCDGSCAPASVDVVAVAFLVKDDAGPSGTGVGRNNPVVSNTSNAIGQGLPLRPSASDSGSGLDRAEVTITNLDGSSPRTFSAPFAKDAGCSELSPGDATNDRPLDTTRCPRGVTDGELAVDWDSFPAGNYKRTVTVFDIAGNSTVALDGEQFEIIHPDLGSRTATLSIGSGSVDIPASPGPGPSPGGGVLGASGSSCRTPRLSVVLTTDPLRISKGVPVLLYKKSYRFTGRLTCVVNGKRKAAPKNTKIDILNTVGKKTVSKPRTAIRSKGAVDVKLAFLSSRTVIFRYTSAEGQRSQVRIKIKVEKKKTKR